MSEVATRSNNGMHSVITEHYQEMNAALHERDEIREKNRLLENDIAIAEGMLKHYKEQLDIITRQRDHYMRHSLALATRMNAARDIFSATLELAEDEALKPGPMKIDEKKLLQELATLPKAANLSSGQSNNCEQDEGA